MVAGWLAGVDASWQTVPSGIERVAAKVKRGNGGMPGGGWNLTLGIG